MMSIHKFPWIADIPVFVGASEPLTADVKDASYWHGEDGLGMVACISEPTMAVSEENAILALIRIIKEHKNQVTLVGIGPLTNVSTLLYTQDTITLILISCDTQHVPIFRCSDSVNAADRITGCCRNQNRCG